jgi:hypothetical protein
MNTIELRNSFHQLIDSFNNENALSKFYSIMLKMDENKDGTLWSRLNSDDRNELERADFESNEDSNLIPQHEILNKHKKWL